MRRERFRLGQNDTRGDGGPRPRDQGVIRGIPFEQRTAFVLAEIQGLPLEQIGAIEGVKLGTVKSRLSRAREKLRSLLRWTVEVEQPR